MFTGNLAWLKASAASMRLSLVHDHTISSEIEKGFEIVIAHGYSILGVFNVSGMVWYGMGYVRL